MTAISVTTSCLSLVATVSMALMFVTDCSLGDAVFETCSAFSLGGYSVGVVSAGNPAHHSRRHDDHRQTRPHDHRLFHQPPTGAGTDPIPAGERHRRLISHSCRPGKGRHGSRMADDSPQHAGSAYTSGATTHSRSTYGT